MAYNTAGLICLTNSAGCNTWLLRTVDAIAGTDAAGYITDAGPANSGKGAPGRGMKVGDMVRVVLVDSVTAPTTATAATWATVSAVNATTGAGTLVLDVEVAP